MKIGIDLREIIDQGRGWETYGKNILKYLVMYSDLSFLIVLEDRRPLPEDFQFLIRQNVNFIFTPIDRSLNFDPQPFPEFENCTIVHSLTEFTEFHVFNPALIVTIHDLSSIKFSQFHSESFSNISRLALSYNLKNAKAIITPSRYIANQINHRNVFPIWHGIDHLEHSENRVPKEHIILYAGGFEPEKNVNYILESFLRVEEKYPDYHLMLCGPNLEKHHNLFSKDFFHHPKIHFLGWVADQELLNLYKRSEFYIQASFDEGFSLTPVEALSQGCKCFCSDIPVHHEIMDDYALYFNPLHISEILGLMENSKHFVTPSFKEVVSKFNWQKTADEIYLVYKLLSQ